MTLASLSTGTSRPRAALSSGPAHRVSAPPRARSSLLAPPPRVEPRAVVRRLRAFRAPRAARSEAQRAEIVRSVHERVEVEGPRVVAAHLSPTPANLGSRLPCPKSLLWRPRQDSNLRPAA